MKENLKLLIEETGCNEEDAKKAFEKTGDNLSQALRIISSVSNYIGIVKGKFICEKKIRYGLFILIFHIPQKKLIRQGVIVSLNPEIYEEDLRASWRSFERKLYTYRLKDGSLQEFTQKLEFKFSSKITFDLHASRENIEPLILSIVKEASGDEEIKLETQFEHLSLDQFKEFKIERDEKYPKGEKTIALECEPVADKSGKLIKIKKLKKNETVLTKIIDSRDIGRYISHLLGGRKENEVFPLSCVVEKITEKNNYFSLTTRLAPSIYGQMEIEKDGKINLARARHSWIRKYWWLPIFGFAILLIFLYLVVQN